jgi:thiamine transporter ThiT
MKKHDNENKVNTQENKKKRLCGKAFLAAAIPVVLHILWHLVLHFGLVAVTAVTFKDSLALGIGICIIVAIVTTIICIIRHKRHKKCTKCGLTAEEHHKH